MKFLRCWPTLSRFYKSQRRLALTLFHVNCSVHTPELTPSYLFNSTAQVILPLMYPPCFSLCLHKHDQVEMSCLNPFPPTMNHPHLSWQLHSLKGHSYIQSPFTIHSHLHLQLFSIHLSHFLLWQGWKMTIISSSNTCNLSLCILLVLFMNINIVEDSFPLRSISCSLKHHCLLVLHFPFWQCSSLGCCYFPWP